MASSRHNSRTVKNFIFYVILTSIKPNHTRMYVDQIVDVMRQFGHVFLDSRKVPPQLTNRIRRDEEGDLMVERFQRNVLKIKEAVG